MLIARPEFSFGKVPFDILSKCPCGSEKLFLYCCHSDNGHVKKALPRLRPSGVLTNFTNKRCYLHDTNNCCSKISGEHYISRSVLEQIKGLRIRGFPWQKNKSELLPISPNSMTANILCKRHNESLSPLDDIAKKTFATLQQAYKFARSKNSQEKIRYFMIDGSGFELWGIKTLMNMHYAGILQTQLNTTICRHRVDISTFIDATDGKALTLGAGMHIQASPHEKHDLGLVTSCFYSNTNHVSALIFETCGFSFVFCTARFNEYSEFSESFRRPVIDIIDRRVSRIYISYDHRPSALNSYHVYCFDKIDDMLDDIDRASRE